mmetsp:Transcript_30083/g.71611  ORF Transcript_30083/g.71611 Transcript_30083/m.71611 type:complete len:116 (-) Transcript_30083:11-358(-)
MWRPSVYLLAAAALASDAAAFAPSTGFAATMRPQSARRCSAPSRAASPMPLQMGLFDGFNKMLNDAMANDASLGKPVNPGFREGYDGPDEVIISFSPSGKQILSYQGEALADVCR